MSSQRQRFHGGPGRYCRVRQTRTEGVRCQSEVAGTLLSPRSSRVVPGACVGATIIDNRLARVGLISTAVAPVRHQQPRDGRAEERNAAAVEVNYIDSPK